MRQVSQACLISMLLFVNWQFHKTHPNCFTLSSGGMPEKRFERNDRQNFYSFYFAFIPFEYECAVRLQDAHTFGKSVMYEWLPVFWQFTVLLCHPWGFTKRFKVRWVKYYHVEEIIFKWKIGEVGHNIRFHFYGSYLISIFGCCLLYTSDAADEL